ncbi:MAG: tRNA threonylcarbamoyladenosine dehydratase [Bacteroidales bacterium]|nr:tRNA threonylcarbamoyladenosine dehydratase [Bacteroidales bacterium]
MNEHWLTRTEWLLGAEALAKLQQSRVLVAGLGGVGAYAAEMLARVGVGHLVLVDNDIISLTNRNRQLLALESTTGQSKTQLMAARLRDINAQIVLEAIDLYIDESSASDLVVNRPLDFVVDAIDTLSPKIALIAAAMKQGLPLVSSMGAGAKRDATMVRLADISKSYNCPLAFMLRKRLRKLGINKGFQAVFSIELPDTKAIIPCEERNKKSQVGSISYLPAVFGCVCAQAAVDGLLLSVSQK